MSYTDFVLDNGQLIRVAYPTKFEDEFWDSVSNAMKIGDMWSPRHFSGCTAELLGMRLERINFSRVIGTL